MRVLAVQNYPDTTLGQIETALLERKAEIVIWQAYDGSPMPDGPFDAMVVLGGIQNALADDTSPWFPVLLQSMRSAVQAGKPVLGVCLGSQLLARAFGAENLVGATREFGWTTVHLTEDGAADPVLGGLDEAFSTFQWHDDTFVLPRGGTRLAGNDATHNQAFRIGRAGYGIQFHFEADRKLLRHWMTAYGDAMIKADADWPRRFEAEGETTGRDADSNGLQIARAWAALI